MELTSGGPRAGAGAGGGRRGGMRRKPFPGVGGIWRAREFRGGGGRPWAHWEEHQQRPGLEAHDSRWCSRALCGQAQCPLSPPNQRLFLLQMDTSSGSSLLSLERAGPRGTGAAEATLGLTGTRSVGQWGHFRFAFGKVIDRLRANRLTRNWKGTRDRRLQL